MPYTRAYQLPSPIAAADPQLTAEETPTRLKPMLNITPSSNWIQETFYALDIVSEEVETDGVTTTIEFLPIKGLNALLYIKDLVICRLEQSYLVLEQLHRI